MPSLMRIAPAGILAAVIVLTAAACASSASVRSGDSGTKSPTSGSSGPLVGLTADQIVRKALKDLAAASSVRISGNVPSQDGDIALDISDVAPASCEGNVVLPLSAASPGASGSAAAAIIEVDGAAYLKLSRSYLESLHAPAAVFAELNGKYIKSTSSSTLADIAKACDLPTLVSEFTQNNFNARVAIAAPPAADVFSGVKSVD